MKIKIPHEVYRKVMHWVNKADFEVSGFGTVKYNAETHSFDVVDAFLLKQEGGAAHTDIDATALSKLMYDTRNNEGDLKWWWHSHVQMGVFWSGTDTQTIKDLGKQGWAVATVFNQKNEYKSAICYTSKTDFNDLIHHEPELPTEILPPPALAVPPEWDAEFTANVTEKKWGPSSNTSCWRGYTSHSTTAGQEEKEIQKAKEEGSETFKKWSNRHGLFGYGLSVEANALGLTSTEYETILEQDNDDEVARLEGKLMVLEAQGKFGWTQYGY